LFQRLASIPLNILTSLEGDIVLSCAAVSDFVWTSSLPSVVAKGTNTIKYRVPQETWRFATVSEKKCKRYFTGFFVDRFRCDGIINCDFITEFIAHSDDERTLKISHICRSYGYEYSGGFLDQQWCFARFFASPFGYLLNRSKVTTIF